MRKTQRTGKEQTTLLRKNLEEDNTKPMVLFVEVKDWLQNNRVEGFIRVAEALPHKDPEKIAKTIDVEDISKATIHAAIEFRSEGL